MPTYSYTARTVEGEIVNGTLSAADSTSAAIELRRKNLIVIEIKEVKKHPLLMLFAPKVKAKEITVFTRLLCTMTSAGVPLVDSLETLQEQTESTTLRKVLGNIVLKIRGGASFSGALSEYPSVFSSTYVNMIRAAEESGQLDQVLDRLASYLESTEELKRDIKSAMIYPIISIVLVLVIASGLILFIVPQFKGFFIQLGMKEEDLPTPTKILLSISDFVLANILIIIIGVIVAITTFKFLTGKVSVGRYYWHVFLLKAPVFGPLINKIALSRFSRTFASLLRAGVPMLSTIEIVAKTTGNAVVEKALLSAREQVSKGESLSSTLSEYEVFPPLIIKTAQIGEQSGELEKLFDKVADFYDHEVRTTVRGLTSLIEPLMILVMGGIVGFIIISIFMPILKIQQKLIK